MNNNLIIPKKINVGFQNREDTYTKKLAYVIYYDEKGVLRKEKSWNSWRDKSIPNQEFNNEPIEGFVLNKHAGGYKSGWDYRKSYIRVYDPRGFEFEIGVENMLYILENCNSIKGKGLEGKFIYAWDGTELVLLPIESPDYAELVAYNQKRVNKEKITNKTLKVGNTYRNNNNEELIYLGKFQWYSWCGNDCGMKQVFANMKTNPWNQEPFLLVEMTSANGKFIEVVSEIPPANLDEMLEIIQHSCHISKIAKNGDMKRYVTLKEVLKAESSSRFFSPRIYFEDNSNIYYISSFWKDNEFNRISCDFKDIEDIIIVKYRKWKNNDCLPYKYTDMTMKISLKELFDKYQIFVFDEYLENGKLYRDGLIRETII